MTGLRCCTLQAYLVSHPPQSAPPSISMVLYLETTPLPAPLRRHHHRSIAMGGGCIPPRANRRASHGSRARLKSRRGIIEKPGTLLGILPGKIMLKPPSIGSVGGRNRFMVPRFGCCARRYLHHFRQHLHRPPPGGKPPKRPIPQITEVHRPPLLPPVLSSPPSSSPPGKITTGHLAIRQTSGRWSSIRKDWNQVKTTYHSTLDIDRKNGPITYSRFATHTYVCRAALPHK
jgi:hypothetical protein